MKAGGETAARIAGIALVVLLALAVRVIGSARAELAEARALDGHGEVQPFAGDIEHNAIWESIAIRRRLRILDRPPQ